jgi:hypothetical protein
MPVVDAGSLYNNVFIGTPTHICKRYCANQFIQAVDFYAPGAWHLIICNSLGNAEIYYRSKHTSVKREFQHLKLDESYYHRPDATHRRLTVTMNSLREQFLSSGKFYYLSLEADVIINEQTLGMLLESIRSSGADIIHSNCYPGFHDYDTFTWVERMTLGCTIVKRSVLDKIAFRYDNSLLRAYPDAFLAEDAVKQGFKIGYDPKIKVEHCNDITGTRGWSTLPFVERS